MNTNRKTRIEIIIEKHDGLLWGRVEDKGNFLPTPYGATINDVINNLRELIEDYQAHEGKEDKFWGKVDLNKVDYEFSYDLVAFFEEFEELKISSIAKRAGINESLMRQYATGKKYPSADQAKKIEDTIHGLAKKLQEASIYA